MSNKFRFQKNGNSISFSMNTLRLSSSHYRSVKKPKMATKSTDNLVNNVGSPESSNVYSECVKKTNWMGQTLYQNPWKTWRNVSIVRFLRYNVWDADHSKIPSQQELDDKLPIVKGGTKEFVEPSSGVKMMWIGHASVLVQFDGLTIITDPVFSEFIVFGTHRRYRSPSCEVKDLPKIDAVLISHNHCDHLDKASVKQLNEKYGYKLKWYAPLGLKSWLNTNGCNNVIQMDWWQEEEFSTEKRTKFCCVPSQHWSKRGPIDDFKTLWCGWALIGPEHSFYFAGDTGYCEVFQQIGRKYGPFTSAAIPIGCYEPRDLMSPQHVDTEEAVKIHKDVKSENSLGIHWGTFKLSHEHYLEPRETLPKIVQDAKLPKGQFFTLKHGEVKVVEKSGYWEHRDIKVTEIAGEAKEV